MKKILHHTRKLLKETHKTFQAFQNKLKKQNMKSEEEILLNEELEKIKPLEPKVTQIEISVMSVTKAALAVIGILALIYFAYEIRSILVIVFVSLIVAAAMMPLVDKWQKHHIPRGVSVIILYIIFLALFGTVVYSLIPIIVEQIVTLTQNISSFANNLLTAKDLQIPFGDTLKNLYNTLVENVDKQQFINQAQSLLSSISGKLGSIAQNSIGALASIFNGIFNAIMVMVITFFMVTDRTSIQSFLHSLLPSRYAPYVALKAHQMQIKIGGWVRGQLLLCLSIGIVTYIGLYILEFFGMHLEYKETLAVLAGVMEFIPYIGPFLAAIPAVLIAMNISGWAVFWVIILYMVTQSLENNVFVPMIMKKEVGLNPIIVLVTMLIGAQFFGVLGIILAIPVTTSISVLVQDYIDKEK